MGFCTYFLLALPVLFGVGYLTVPYTPLAGLTPWLHPMPYGFTEDQIPDDKIAKQTFLVTGSNVGLGLSTVEHLARHGAGTIIFTARSLDKLNLVEKRLKSIRKPHTRLVPAELNLASLKAVKSLTDKLKADGFIPNVIIANAGVMDPPFTLTEDGIELQFQVNHIAHHFLIRELLPSLEEVSSPENPGRIVIVASGAHRSSPLPLPLTLAEINNETKFRGMPWYGLSKLANILESNQLAQLVGPNVYVNSLDPGAVDTELAAHYYQGSEVKTTLATYVKAALMWQPEIASLTIVAAATSDDVITKPIRGGFFSPIGRIQAGTQIPESLDLDLSRRLYEFSEQLLKERGF